MQAVDVYLMYCALKAHFGKGDYDFVKYGGKSSATKTPSGKEQTDCSLSKLKENTKRNKSYKITLCLTLCKTQKAG